MDFFHLSASKREYSSHSEEFYFISHTKRNNASFNYVKTNINSLLFTFLSINFNAFLIPPHWLANQPLKLLLPCNVFQSFLINLDFKMIYYYLCTLWKWICCLCWVSALWLLRADTHKIEQTKISNWNTDNF